MISGEPCRLCGGDGYAEYKRRHDRATWVGDSHPSEKPCPECHGTGLDQEDVTPMWGPGDRGR